MTMSAIETKKDHYGLKMVLLIGVLFAIMAVMFYKIQQPKTPPPVAGYAAMPPVTDKTIHILKSYATATTFQKNGIGVAEYKAKLERFDNYLKAMGYKTAYIEEKELDKLPTNAILMMPETIALSTAAKQQIAAFVSGGGNLFMNFSVGFSDESGKYVGDGFLKQLTGLALSEKQFVKFESGMFLTQRLLSPLNNENTGILLDAPTYDAIPILESSDNQPIIYMSSYDQTNPPSNGDSAFTHAQSGAAWSGYYGKGKWFYTNYPSYVFYDASAHANNYKNLTHAIINYLDKDAMVAALPFVDSEHVVFVSEDTEYKFENFEKFSNLAAKYQFPVTAFIVSSLAEREEHKEMMQKIAQNLYVEFGSHSHSHQKIIDTNESYVAQETKATKGILDKFGSNPVTGFRPPREELDTMMKANLSDGGFRYVLNVTHKYMYPRFDTKYHNLLVIPRHGTDDYAYLINLDWDQEQIVAQMKAETEFVTGLDGIYTMSLHTHLFAYSSNIDIVDNYMRYIKSDPKYTPMDGRSIAKRVALSQKIDLKSTYTANLLTVEIDNANSEAIKAYTCKLFNNPNHAIASVKCDNGEVRVKENERGIDLVIDTLAPNAKTRLFITFQG